jgi:hypothetical protein
MGKGRGVLEIAYFRFDVLEGYRNDPRFTGNRQIRWTGSGTGCREQAE